MNMNTNKRARAERRSSVAKQDSDESDYIPSPNSPKRKKSANSSIKYKPKSQNLSSMKRQRTQRPAIAEVDVLHSNPARTSSDDELRRRNTSQWCAVLTTESVQNLRQLALAEGIPNSSDTSKRNMCEALQTKMGLANATISSYEDDLDTLDIPRDLQDAFSFKLLVDPYVTIGGETYNQSTLYELYVRKTRNHLDKNNPYSTQVIRNNHIKRMAEQWAIEHGLNLTTLRMEEKAKMAEVKQLEQDMQPYGRMAEEGGEIDTPPQLLQQQHRADFHEQVIPPMDQRRRAGHVLRTATGLLHRFVDYVVGSD
jgi:hypothetical protein